MTTLRLIKSTARSPLRRGLLLIPFLFACFALAPTAQAVVPAPDGGYPGFNTAEGQNALFSLTTGAANTAVGWYSLFSDTAGSFNTATGAGALLFNTSNQNTAFGTAALLFNTSGSFNTAVGTAALLNNTEGNQNTAIGDNALPNNTTGFDNTANGVDALFNNSTGHDNSATGFQALASNTVGVNNTANGVSALFSNTEGNSNTANGLDALALNTTGDENMANGNSALFSNTEGNSNTANGVGALGSNTIGNFNTASGYQALFNNTTGGGNTAMGTFAGNGITSANNVIAIASNAANVSDSCFIGNIYSNVQPIVGTDPDSVTITSTGRLGRGNVSSRRYKHDIKPMEKASEALYALKPVSFRYNKEYDATQTLAFGLIAEEVAEVYPDLVGRNPKGEPESVRYEQINAMLLNEFLKEHKACLEEQRKVEDQQATIAQLKKDFSTTIAQLTARLNEQAVQIQKVSAQLETSKPAPQTVLNNQ